MRVVIVDQSELFCDGLAAYLTARGHEVLGSAGTVEGAVDRCDLGLAQGVVIDARSLGEGASELVLRHAKNEVPRLVVLTTEGHSPPVSMLPLILSCRSASVDRCSDLGVLERVLRGGRTTAPASRSRVLAPAQRPILTAREDEVIGGLVRGQSTATIAHDLGVSVHTVHTHVQRILRKLGAKNRVEAVSSYLRIQARSLREGGGVPASWPVHG